MGAGDPEARNLHSDLCLYGRCITCGASSPPSLPHAPTECSDISRIPLVSRLTGPSKDLGKSLAVVSMEGQLADVLGFSA